MNEKYEQENAELLAEVREAEERLKELRFKLPMHPSTQLLCTKLHLEKLSRLAGGQNWQNTDWTSYEAQKLAAENFYKVKFVPTESEKGFMLLELQRFFVQHWEKNFEPCY